MVERNVSETIVGNYLDERRIKASVVGKETLVHVYLLHEIKSSFWSIGWINVLADRLCLMY
jgi:hypothetical protein